MPSNSNTSGAQLRNGFLSAQVVPLTGRRPVPGEGRRKQGFGGKSWNIHGPGLHIGISKRFRVSRNFFVARIQFNNPRRIYWVSTSGDSAAVRNSISITGHQTCDLSSKPARDCGGTTN